MNFLKFYEDKRSEFKYLEFISSLFENDPKIRKQLAKAKKYQALKKLCGGQDEIMFTALQAFLILHRLKKAESFETK